MFDVTTTVEVVATAVCPKCKRSLSKPIKYQGCEFVLTHVPGSILLQGLQDAESDVREEAVKRGWTADMCGQCRDPK
jgi:hypothetical protein